jgi:microcystin-dependent protein
MKTTPIKISQEVIRIQKPQPKKLRIVRNGKDGKTPTREELLSIIAPLIPEAPKTSSRREIKKLIEDYIAKSVKEPPSLDFEIKETDLWTEIFINGKKHIIPKAIYWPKLRNLQQMGDVSLINPTDWQSLVFRDWYWVNEEWGGWWSVASVTWLNTDNTDPANPVVQISVDGVTITGAGTPWSPLVAIWDGTGDVHWPASSVDDRIATFDGTTGKIIQDGGVKVSDLATAAQGALADSALQSSDIGVTVQAHSSVLDNTTASFTTADETKLDGIEAWAEVNTIDTVSDTSEIDLTITAKDLTATIVAWSIDESKLDTSVNASLDLADSAVQNLADLWITATDAEINVLDGITASTAELNYTDGVTSNIQTQLDGKVDENWAITWATKTKITYDAKGLVTSWADATTADIASSIDKRYVTDAQLVVIGNTSNINTGDQTSIVGITGTKAQFNTAVTDGDIVYTDAIGVSVQGYSSVLQNTTASFTTTDETKLDFITVTQAVDLDTMEADIAALANGMVYKGNWDASAGTFPGGWTAQTGWFYTVSVGWTVDSVVFNIDDRLVATTDNASTTTYAWNWTKLDATDAVTSVFGRTGNVVATSGDYNTSQVTENTNLYFTDERAQDAVWNAVGAGLSYDDGTGAISSTITQYTDELAQDAVGWILTDSAEIDFTYNDWVPSITASIVSGSIDETKLDASVNASLDLADTAVQPAWLSNYFNKTTDDTDDITDTATNRFTTDTDITRLANTSGTNTGDQTSVSGNAWTATALQNARTIGTLTGDVTTAGSSFDGTANNTNATTLATVNSNVGSFGSATAAGTFTVNAKWLVTAAGSTTITPAVGSITGLWTGVWTALAINVGSAGAPVLFNWAGGTPSSMTATNLTGTASGLTAGNVTTNANLTGVVTSVGNATSIADAALSIAKTSGLQTALDGKQATLVSATNIKTINSNSLLGAGDLVIPALTDGDKGDITVSSSGATWTIDNDVVTYAKIQNVSATDRLLGRDTAGAGDVEELTVSGGLEFTGTGIQRSALTGEVTASAGSNTIILDKTAISSKLSVNPALDDYVLIGDTNNSDNLKKTTISNIGNLFGQIPIGWVIDWAASTLPTGYLYCDGSVISRTTYADLFTVIGTTFGAGDGSTTYALPDARGRTIAGMDNMNNVAGTGGGDAGRLTSASKAGIDGDTLGASGGVQEHPLLHEESGVPAHSHPYYDRYNNSVNRGTGWANTGSASVTGVNVTTSNNTATDASEAHTNVQPTLVLNKIIRFWI